MGERSALTVGGAVVDSGCRDRRDRQAVVDVLGAPMGRISTEELEPALTSQHATSPGAGGVIDVRTEVVPVPTGGQTVTSDRRPGADRTPLRRYLLAGDLVALVLAWVPWYLGVGNSPLRDLVSALAAIVVTLLAMRKAGLYQSRVCALRSAQVVRTVTAAAVGALAYIVLQWMAGNGRVSVLPALGAALMSCALILLLRWRFDRWLKARRSDGDFLRTVVMVGTNDDALALWTTLDSEPELGYRVGAVVGEFREEVPWAGLPCSSNLEDLGGLAGAVGANGVIVVGSGMGAVGSGAVVEKALAAGLHLQVWSGLSGLGGRRVRLAPVSGLPFLYIEPFRGLSRANEIGKRTVDLILGSLLCLLTLPLVILGAIMIRLEDGSPAIYRSQRVGRNEAPITVFKLRTMVPNAAQMMDSIADLNERTGGPLFKADNDPRITRVGRLLRVSSIDELPQLWNVLNGTMSLVGPRPALPAEVAKFDAEFSRRHLMRPGITGLWQIEARDNPSFWAYRRLDLSYVDTWSFGLDLEILATTAHSVMVRAVRPVWKRIARRGTNRPRPTSVPVPAGPAPVGAVLE
jgi:exopolysaccharide biosynthesis polyprenyl glycosylphosphotransferase